MSSELSPEVKLNRFAICALVAYLILPILNRGLPAFVRVVIVCGLLLIYLLSLYLIDKEGSIETIGVLIVSVGFVILCYYGSAHTVGLPQYLFVAYLFWIPFLFIYNHNYMRDYEFRRFLSRFILTLLGLTVLSTLAGLITDPMVARNMATGLTEEYGLRTYSLRNIGGYGFIYSLVLVIPLIIAAIRFSDIKKSYLVLFLALAIFCIFRSQYSTALCLSIVALTTIFFGNKLTPIKLCGFVLCEAMFLSILFSLLPAFIDWVSGLGPQASFMAYRLRDFLGTISGSTGIRGLERTQRAEMSWNIFLNNPLLGNLSATSMSEIGGHSTFLDLLASMGLLAVPFIIFFILAVFGRTLKRLVPEGVKPYSLVTFLLFFILGCINTVLSSFTIPVVIFLLPIGLMSESFDDTSLNEKG